MNAPILVVDDDPKIVSLVRLYLERDGFRVTTASDGRAALTAVETEPPRLIVLDLMLPELDGLAVLRRLRERSTVPVMMLSARGAVADRVYGISEGADDYLAKPFSPAELVVRVKALFRRVAPEPVGPRGPSHSAISRSTSTASWPGVASPAVADSGRIPVAERARPSAGTRAHPPGVARCAVRSFLG